MAKSGAGSLSSLINPGTQGVVNTPPAAPLDNFSLSRVDLGPAGFAKDQLPDIQQDKIPVGAGKAV
jgi:hypothetical protein